MKQKTITTTDATVLAVELPEGSHYVYVCKHIRDGIHYLLYDWAINTAYKEFLPDGNWQLIGRIPDITEGDLYTLGFRSDKMSSILDRLENIILKNNIYFKNTYGETEPLPPWQDVIESEGLHANYKNRLRLWQERQSKVWDKERTFLFIKSE